VKSAFKILSSLTVGALCTYLVVRNMDAKAVSEAFGRLSGGDVAVYLVTLASTHFFRAIRWAHLLRPIGVHLPIFRLIAVSSVGFMAILALPFRLGEFVRPYYVVRSGQSRMSEVLGTVAVERVVDGLLISLLLFATYLTSTVEFSRPINVLWDLPVSYFAWLSLGLFVSATLFLLSALVWGRAFVNLTVRFTLLPRVAPSLAEKICDKLNALISGFRGLSKIRHMGPFIAESVLYWGCNGLGMWLLAQAIGLDLSPVAAFAAMALTGVAISLPNSPGLVGQFHVAIVAVAAAYLGNELAGAEGLAYAVVLHAIQACWYLGVGLVALRFTGAGSRSLWSLVRASTQAADTAN